MTIIEYVRQIYPRQRVIAEKMGVDISRSSKAIRVINLAMAVLLSVVVKVLVDKGVVTDQELIAALNSARDAPYDDEPVHPPPSTTQPETS